MGDPLSVAAAVLSLPGIFMSCVQCFELIQRGRNFERDLLILTTKFSNQQLRFTKWGEACGFGSTAGYNKGLNEPELRPHIERTLYSIKLLLDSGVAVSKLYCEDHVNHQSVALSPAVSTRWSWTTIKSRLSKSQRARATKDATKWALADKAKLDEIVKHLSDLIEDLENMTKDLGVPERQRYLVQYEIQSISDTGTLELMEASRINSDDMISETASIRLQSISNRNPASSRQHGSILDVLSVPDTNFTAESYVTAPESAVPDQTIPTVNVGHNSRIMNDLLRTAKPHQEATQRFDFDASATGKLIHRVDSAVLQQAVGNHPDLFKNCSVSRDAARRIAMEFKLFHQYTKYDPETWWKLYPAGDNLVYILGSIEGPPNSPYQGGVFHIAMKYPADYPFRAPRCRMLTKIYHPNINQRGEICLDILGSQWSPPLQLSTVLMSIGLLLDKPGLEDPLVPEIAATYIEDKATYDAHARAYTQKYAREFCLTSKTAEKSIEMCEVLEEEEEASSLVREIEAREKKASRARGKEASRAREEYASLARRMKAFQASEDAWSSLFPSSLEEEEEEEEEEGGGGGGGGEGGGAARATP